jgi:1-acyl-sn-glycerol-3-phosphate acyltransferase
MILFEPIMWRSLAFNIWFYAITVVLLLTTGLYAVTFAHHRAIGVATFWARLVERGLWRLCGIRLVLEGGEHLPAGPALIASQHQSAFDTLVWLNLVPKPCYVMKKELSWIPLFGRLTRIAGMITVDRSGGAAALRGLVRDTTAAVAAGKQVIIFPEGTRSSPEQILELQPGIAAMARAAGLPVVPVATNSGHYWGRRTFLKHPGEIRLRVLPPIPPGLPRGELLARLRDAWSAALPVDTDAVDKFGDRHTETFQRRLS